MERITLVSHSQIFRNQSHLPTFNSVAIETHLHRIPGLSRRFIYFNDDFAFQAPVSLEDFWTIEKGYKIYHNGPIGNKSLKRVCPQECNKLLSDGICQTECNMLSCLWDENDCDTIQPSDENIDKRSAYFQTIDFVNILFERTLTKGSTRNWIPHMPMMFDIHIIKGKCHVIH